LITSEYSPVKGTAIKLVSLTGQLIQYIRNTDTTGEILRCTVEALKNGGTNAITFSVDRRTNVPVFPGMIVEVYKDGEKYAIGYANTVPKSQSSAAELEVVCLGYLHKLSERIVNVTYSTIDIKDILLDLEPSFNSVDIKIDTLLLDLPAITVASLAFEDKTLSTVVHTILQIANTNYETAQYRWFVDNDRYLNFELIEDFPYKGIYEGYQYQNPEAEEEDTDIVNRVLAYRTDVANPKELEYVAQYDATESQGIYGIRDKKIIFPDFMDTATMQKFATAILQENKDQKVKVLLEDLEGTDFPFRFYKLNDRTDVYWQILSECDSFNGWDISAAIDTVVTLSEEQVLTGRNSIKCATANNSFNEFIQYNEETPIFGPQLFRMYMYMEDSMIMDIEVIDTNDVAYSFSLGRTDLKLEANETLTIIKNISVDDTSAGSSDYGESNYGEDNYG
jgi:hypothetical protein